MNIDLDALRAIEEEHGVGFEEMQQRIGRALLHTYHEYGNRLAPNEKVRIDIDQETGEVSVVIYTEDEEGNVLKERDATPWNFAVNAIRVVRDTIHQVIRNSDIGRVFDQYAPLERSVVSGIVEADAMANAKGIVKVRIGSERDFCEGYLLPNEQIPGEKLKHGQRIKCYVVNVNRHQRGVDINLSRTHPEMVSGLFKLEIPECASERVEIVSIAREAGHRSKISVRPKDPGLNAKGACIGPRGQRINAISEDLGGEKIDIIDYDEDPAKYVGNALAPSRVVSVEILDREEQRARVVVPDYQLSLAIGREGQNARLAARLTGWKIDIHSDAEATN
ncbi:MAG: transcription termination factor NusA [Corynebacterium sp.]|nr:transcription termination factor NusA [Corynebacterium sp.]